MNTTTMALRERWAEWLRSKYTVRSGMVEVRSELRLHTSAAFDPSLHDVDAMLAQLRAEQSAQLADALYGPLRAELLDLELELQQLNAPYHPRTHHAWQVLRAIIDSLPS